MTRARNSANLASDGNLFVDIANDRTGIGSVAPAQNLHVAGTAGFHADTTFVGDLYNTTWDRSANSLKFVDNARIRIGSGDDFQIYHDGSFSRILNTSGDILIKNSASGRYLYLQSAIVMMQPPGGGDVIFDGRADGPVKLYHDGSQKFQTTAYGTNITGTTDTDGLIVSGVATVTTMNVTGVLTYDDVTSVDSVGIVTARQGVVIPSSNQKLVVGPSGNLEMFYSSSHGSLLNTSDGGDIRLRIGGNTKGTFSTGGFQVNGGLFIEDSIHHSGDTATRIRFPSDDTIHLDTGGTNRLLINSSGNATFSGNLTVSGNLSVTGTTTQNNTVSTTEKTITLASGAANNAAVDGAGIVVDAGSDTDKTLKWLDSTDRWTFTGGDVSANAFYGNGANLTNLPAAQLSGTAAAINGSNITNLNGSNIASGTVPVARIGTGTKNTTTFYRGDGTFQVVNTDLVSDTSPQLGGDLDTNSHEISLDDNHKVKFGAGNDLQIYSDGAAGYIDHVTTGTGADLILRSKTFVVRNLSNENMIVGNQNGAVLLYYDNTQMFATESRGAILQKADTCTLIIGSTNAGGAQIFFDGDSNGDGNGGDYAAIRHNSDGNLSIEADNPSTNANILFGAGDGSEKVRISSNGNILVGKTADAGKGLEIYQSANAALRIQNSTTGQGAGDGLLIETAASDALFWNYENAANRFGTNNIERLRITETGAVAISGNRNQLAPTTYNDLTGSNQAGLLIGSSGLTDAGIVFRTSTSGTGRIYFGDNSGSDAGRKSGQINYYHNGDFMIFATADTERVRITSAGHLKMPDAKEIQLGNDNQTATGDLRLYHNGSNSAVQNSQGALYISNKETNSSDLHLQGKTSIQMHCPADGNVRLKVDNNGRIKFFPAGESGGTQGAPMYLQVQTDVINVNSPTGGTDQAGMFRIEDRGSTNGRYHGIELRNRNSGDIRILNKDVNVSNGAVLVFAVDDNGQFTGSGTIRQYLQINGQGQTSAITLSGAYHVVASARDGLSSANAAASAWEIKKTLGPAARTGYYYLKNPYDGTTSQWWCDMETDGGGWVLIAHTGDGGMSDQGTGGTHWWSRNNKGGFDPVGAGYYAGGGYWRQSNGAWGENTNGQLMWDVRTHYSEFNNQSNDKVVFNWGTDQALPSGSSGYGNIPNASNRRFNEWCYPVVNAPGFNPMNYDRNVRSNTINGNEHFTEHMLMTWSFRNTGGNADNGSDGPYWQIGAHANGLHQHYEESISGDAYGDGSYGVISNEDTGWGGGGTNNGYRRIGRDASSGTCNVWLR